MKAHLLRFLAAALLLLCNQAFAAKLKPFVLAATTDQPLAAAAAATRAALTAHGFEIVGTYSPYDGTEVIVATNDSLREAASRSEFGGFAAGQRVALTRSGDTTQISYANPAYTAAAYRLESDLEPITRALAAALGNGQPFGSEEGLDADELRKYHYMFAMPYFDDMDELKRHASHATALSHVERALGAQVAGATKIYRIDLPGREQVVFGIGLAEGEGADATVMAATDTAPLKHTAQLPYELLVAGERIYALAGKFRIAVNFPDLSMGTFMKIANAPKGIREALAAVAGRD